MDLYQNHYTKPRPGDTEDVMYASYLNEIVSLDLRVQHCTAMPQFRVSPRNSWLSLYEKIEVITLL